MENFMANINLSAILFAVLLTLIVVFIIYSQYTMKKNVKALSEEEFAGMMRKGQLIDVRKKEEFAEGHINGSRNFPLATLTRNMSGLRGDQPIFLVCTNDKQNSRATAILQNKNFITVYCLEGGISSWSKPLKTKK